MAREHDEDETEETVATPDDATGDEPGPDDIPDERDEPDDPGPDDADDADEPGGAGPRRAPARRALDGRTLAICALVALIAAILAGLVTARLTDDDEPEAAKVDLAPAEGVPDVELASFADDDTISPTDYAGRPLVINFWASWCTPCIEEMPAFERVHQSLGDQVAFLGVNSRDEDEAARQMIETTGVTYDLAVDTDGALARALEVTNLPVTVLVLPDGTVARTFQRKVSAERLCEAVNQSLLFQSLEECG